MPRSPNLSVNQVKKEARALRRMLSTAYPEATFTTVELGGSPSPSVFCAPEDAAQMREVFEPLLGPLSKV